jgi:RNA polymerase sigma-70 factor (sigma-E family)
MRAMAVEEARGATSFDEWVAARQAALQRFAYLVSGSAADAPDLVQDALSRAWPRWDSLSRRGTAEAYVRRSIVNGAVSGWRKTRRTVAVADVAAVADQPVVTDSDDALVAWAVVQQLTTTQRAAVVLRFYEDLSYAEIAAVLGCPETTARSHVHRALSTLRSRLEEDR